MSWMVHGVRKQRGNRYTENIFDIETNTGERMEYTTLTMGSGVAIFAVTSDNKVVIQKHFRVPFLDYKWEIPVGGLKDGLSLLDNAKLELKEETGYTSDDWTYVGSITTLPGNTNGLSHIFIARDIVAGENALELGEDIEAHLVTLDEFEKMVLSNEFDMGIGQTAYLRYILLNK